MAGSTDYWGYEFEGIGRKLCRGCQGRGVGLMTRHEVGGKKG